MNVGSVDEFEHREFTLSLLASESGLAARVDHSDWLGHAVIGSIVFRFNISGFPRV